MEISQNDQMHFNTERMCDNDFRFVEFIDKTNTTDKIQVEFLINCIINRFSFCIFLKSECPSKEEAIEHYLPSRKCLITLNHRKT